MPNSDFWFLAGLGCAFVGFGIMKLLLAYASALDDKEKIRVLEDLRAELVSPEASQKPLKQKNTK